MAHGVKPMQRQWPTSVTRPGSPDAPQCGSQGRTSTERGLVGMQLAGVAPGSPARSATSRMVTLGRVPAAAASLTLSSSASQAAHRLGRPRSRPHVRLFAEAA